MKDTLKELTRLLGDKSSGSSPILVLAGSALDSGKGSSFSPEGWHYFSRDCR